eukprot:CAMPEP_0204390066 /NCGR_PEP_ID=MMETSP0469-20131031/60476_1 /ASSEMBLY_ACC=CAM_ASM_000384 /TAXON_ID=2969 /ORGANISM="Oxyrrhis marina" /LENGTH=58 /DNA_ID=CAMNT_0051383851 /DNA_START=49 /DNA_END=222 /DNA_ORIENTATION=-
MVHKAAATAVAITFAIAIAETITATDTSLLSQPPRAASKAGTLTPLAPQKYPASPRGN